jgi:hypothetical protein
MSLVLLHKPDSAATAEYQGGFVGKVAAPLHLPAFILEAFLRGIQANIQ